MDLESFELVILRRPDNAVEYDDETLVRLQREHLAFVVDVMTWLCPPGTMARPGTLITIPST
jgi:hypothetical protein